MSIRGGFTFGGPPALSLAVSCRKRAVSTFKQSFDLEAQSIPSSTFERAMTLEFPSVPILGQADQCLESRRDLRIINSTGGMAFS
ncbi:MAG: hypothetical protein EB078_04665 [Proteobacteria bacterium]|nr:hypothetical protein [Pseudomonadota bacterium]